MVQVELPIWFTCKRGLQGVEVGFEVAYDSFNYIGTRGRFGRLGFLGL